MINYEKFPTLTVIGGPSVDRLFIQDHVYPSIGGAGLYTSLAANRAGCDVTMISTKPDPLPVEFELFNRRVHWIGPAGEIEDLPSFDIHHYPGSKDVLATVRWGAEDDFTIEDLPADFIPSALVYCIPMSRPTHQIEFLKHYKKMGCCTAAGTFDEPVALHPELVRKVIETADYFFCNEKEITGLFDGIEAAHTTPGKVLFITRGENGAMVIQGDHQTQIPGVNVKELDATGAGDTFCGTTLALLAQGWHPVEAARQAVVAAAEMVTMIGPTALLQSSPIASVSLDARIRVDGEQTKKVAAVIAGSAEVTSFDHMGSEYPPLNHPHALDFWFASTLQQFGFWKSDGTRYLQPMYGTLAEKKRKGSDYLWMAYRLWLDQDPEGLTPAGQANLRDKEFALRMRSDFGDQPLTMFEVHLHEAQRYGRDMLYLGWTPEKIVARANESQKPLQTFLSMLDHIAGYKEDPLRKKSALLAMILQMRPEKFLRISPEESLPPPVDYHLMRSCLRMGLIEVLDYGLRQKLINRLILPLEDEFAIRTAAYNAVLQLQEESGQNMHAVDMFLFEGRRRCPEMTEPDCPSCLVNPVCVHRKELFQPVRRTTMY